MSKSARWLELLAYLLAHRAPVKRQEIFAAVKGYGDPGDDDTVFESARRKFERDKDELRALGINIETVPLPHAAHDESQHGYRLAAGDFYLPYVEITAYPVADRPYPGIASIQLTEDDLALLDRATARVVEHREFPLAEAAASARRKLAFDLPIAPLRVERILAEPMSAETQRVLAVLQAAVANEQRIRCRYHSIGRDVESARGLLPHGLFFDWGHWYCVATEDGESEPKVFRVDRIRDAEIPPPTRAGAVDASLAAMPREALLSRIEAFDQPPPQRVNIRDYIRRPPWQLSRDEPVEVVVRIAYPESRWVEARGLGERIGEPSNDGTQEFQFQVRSRGPFLRWLLTLRDRATIVRPAEFSDALAEVRDEVSLLYG